MIGLGINKKKRMRCYLSIISFLISRDHSSNVKVHGTEIIITEGYGWLEGLCSRSLRIEHNDIFMARETVSTNQESKTAADLMYFLNGNLLVQ
jgi:hypothetical protein